MFTRRLLLALPILLVAMPAGANPLALLGGDILVVDPRDGSPALTPIVVRVDPVTGAQTVLAEGGFLGNPRDVDLEADGRVVLADPVADAVIRIDPLAFDPGDLFANQEIVSSGGLLNDPRGVLVDPAGDLYVADVNPQQVIRVDPQTGAQTLVAQGGLMPAPYRCRRLAQDAAGMLYLPCHDAAPRVVRVDPDAFDPGNLFANQAIVASDGLFNRPWDVVFDLLGRLLLLNANDYNVIRVDVDAYDPGNPGANQERVADSGFMVENRGIGLEEDGHAIVTDESGTPEVIRIDPDAFDPANPGSNQVVVSSGGSMQKPRGVRVVPLTECNDGLDNDGNGLVDYAEDPGCEGALDPEEASSAPACMDGVDNDGDGYVDFDGGGVGDPDPGCSGPSDAQETDPALPCDDGVDNDGDLLIDIGQDPACAWASAPEDPECDDDLDNDGDGGIDWDGGSGGGAADVHCQGMAWVVRENLAPACGLGIELVVVLAGLARLRTRRLARRR